VLVSISGSSALTNGPMTYIADGGGGAGGGGTFCFPFLASNLGDASLALEYRRAGDTTLTQNYAVTIHVTPAPPRLSIRLVEANVVISWPVAGSTSFFLEGTTRLETPQWTALNVLPLPEGANYTVTLGTGGNARYFRLHRL